MFAHQTIPLPQRNERHGVIRLKLTIHLQHHQFVNREEQQVNDDKSGKYASCSFVHVFINLRPDREKYQIVVVNRPYVIYSAGHWMAIFRNNYSCGGCGQ